MSLLIDGAKGGSAAWKKTKLRAETLFNTWATTVNAGQAATGCRKWDALPASVLCTRPVYEKYAQYLVHEYTSANRPMDHRPAGSPPAHESEKSGPGHSVVAPQRMVLAQESRAALFCHAGVGVCAVFCLTSCVLTTS